MGWRRGRVERVGEGVKGLENNSCQVTAPPDETGRTGILFVLFVMSCSTTMKLDAPPGEEGHIDGQVT